ncbi:ras-related protein Rap-1b-like [Planoprotostelium fungivorum]|uniref:small monomeric GTPase n=1 Tax=Planoprotostelium fungivorum TaxID=1890364 RepID=A0A2P6NZR9_9EUKA|nr:ras-related protein Rap-1b-like [Planoprotostelium fungivorum]
MTTLKITALGAGAVGKSAITVRFCNGIWVERYDPTIEDSYRKMMELDGTQYLLEVLDTAGTEHFTAMRDLYIKNGQGFVLIYSITSEGSFHDLEEIRRQIVDIKGEEKAAMIMLGNKCDLEGQRVISQAQGKETSSKWKCPWFETSAKNNTNIDDAFTTLTRRIISAYDIRPIGTKTEKKKGKCTLL